MQVVSRPRDASGSQGLELIRRQGFLSDLFGILVRQERACLGDDLGEGVACIRLFVLGSGAHWAQNKLT